MLTLVDTTPECGACGYEGRADVRRHCESSACHWALCPDCGAVIDHDGRFIPKEDRKLAAEAA